MAVTIDGTSGLSGVDGSAATPALQGTDTNTGISFGTDTVNVVTGGSTRTTVDSSGRLLVGTSSTSANCRAIVQSESSDAAGSGIFLLSRGNNSPASTQALGQLWFTDSGHGQAASIEGSRDGGTWTSGSSQPSKLTFSTTANGASSPTERMRIRSDGQIVCVATYDNTTANAANVHIFTDKSLGRSTSSIKYKENVEDLQDIYADAILNCRPVWYQSKCTNDNPDWGYWGFIAEEVEQVDPRLCHYGADENGDQVVESVQYDRFVPHLLNLIKRQKEAIEALETRVAQLEGGTN